MSSVWDDPGSEEEIDQEEATPLPDTTKEKGVGLDLSPEKLESMASEILEKVAREIVPQLAEKIIREKLDELLKASETASSS